MTDWSDSPAAEDLLSEMPRRPNLAPEFSQVDPPTMMERFVLPKVGLLRILWRCLAWGRAMFRMQMRLRVDRLRGRKSEKNFGIRLRQSFEEMGGTAIKVGQQLSMRIDLLPFEACNELARMFDRVSPIETPAAIAAIEASTGQPLAANFRCFDPDPVGSASLACVYQAELLTGERVAVKVKRPGIDYLFSADLKAIDLMLSMLELLTVVRPDFFKSLREELRSMFVEELDFRKEARFQALFRKNARKDRIKYLTTPKVYHDYTQTDLMVSEFIEGIGCAEVLAIKESGDPEALKQLAEMDIDPTKLGKRLLHIGWWGTFEHIFFHADPHPGNIVVLPGSRLVFLDFGSCGTASAKVRDLQRKVFMQLLSDDVSGMVESMIKLLEPLPFINVYELKKKMEARLWHHLYAVRSRQAHWWERTSAGLWVSLVDTTKEFNLPIQLDTIRMMRSSLLYDTLAARLWPKMRDKEFLKYTKRAKKRRNRRLGKALERTYRAGIGPTLLDHVQELGMTVGKIGNLVNSLASSAPTMFHTMAAKGSYIVSVAMRLTLSLGLVTAVGILVALFAYPDASWAGRFSSLLQHPSYRVILGIFMFLSGRRILFRLNDLDPPKSEGG